MTKIKLKRSDLFELLTALTVCRRIDVPSWFTYAAERTLPRLEEERSATLKAFPAPNLQPYFDDLSKATPVNGELDPAKRAEIDAKHKDLLDAQAKWSKDIEPHMAEDVEVEVHKTRLPNINDDSIKDEARRREQNRLLVKALIPMLIPPEPQLN